MQSPRMVFDYVVKQLERIQVNIGKTQVSLLDVLTDETVDEWDDAAHAALIMLENVQRRVGETQICLLHQMAAREQMTQAFEPKKDPSPEKLGSSGVSEVELASASISTKGSTVNMKVWLKQRGIEIKSFRETSKLDAVADRASLYLGDNFATLKPFYEFAKRRVNGHSGKWFPVNNLSVDTINHICYFGAKLQDSGFARCKYVKNNQVILFEPLDDGRVKNFFTGAWLERYVLQVVKRILAERLGIYNDDQAFIGTKVLLPDGTHAEFDILVGLTEGKVLWIECKTGEWRDYIKRFQTLNKQFIKLPSEQIGLVLLEELSPEGKDSAGELADMTVLHLAELLPWLNKAFDSK